MPTIREALTAFFMEASQRILEEQGANDVTLRVLPAAVPLSIDELWFKHDQLTAEKAISGGAAVREAANNHFEFSDRLNRIPSATGVLFDVVFDDETLTGVLEDVFERGELLVPSGDLSDSGEAARRLQDIKRTFLGPPPFPLSSQRGEYWPVFHTPGVDDLVRDETWRHFRMTGAEILNAAAQADNTLKRLLSNSTSFVDSELDDLEITEFSVDFVVLALRRPWLDRDLFHSRSWDFEAPLSTGDGDPEQRLPCYVAATLVTRNMKVSGRVRGDTPGRLRPLEFRPILNTIPFRMRILNSSAPLPNDSDNTKTVPVVLNLSGLISENEKNMESAESAVKRNLEEQRDLEDKRRRRAVLVEKESDKVTVLRKLRADERGITFQIRQASAMGNIRFLPNRRKSIAKLKTKRAGKRREMTRAKRALEADRARIATFPSAAELDRRLQKLQKNGPKLKLLAEGLRQDIQRLSELASHEVAKGMNEVAYFCRDVPKAPDPNPDFIRFGGLRGL